MKSLVKFFALVLVVMVTKASAQIQYTRSYDQTGINVYEPSKTETAAYEGFKLHIGGSFRQGYQMLSHENTDTTTTKKNGLYALGKRWIYSNRQIVYVWQPILV